MHSPAADIARRLAEDAEAVCRHYLTNGRKQGRYWIVGDAHNTPGRSLYVRLTGPISGPGAAGKWTDSATGQHGDLLDLIALNMGITTLRDTLDEARRFPKPAADGQAPRQQSASLSRLTRGGAAALGHGPADVWHLGRNAISQSAASPGWAISTVSGFTPNCFYWREDQALTDPPETWPALLAKVTDLDGRLTGLHRTWLDPATADKGPPVSPPRKAMGNLLGHGVRIGIPVSRAGRRRRAGDHALLASCAAGVACGGGLCPPSNLSRSPAAARRSSPPLHRPLMFRIPAGP